MIYQTYKKQMVLYGESYASAFYILAALVLAIAGAGMSKFYDTAAGAVFFIADISILLLQFLNKAPRSRAILLFGGSILGSLILLCGSIFDDFSQGLSSIELTGAVIRLISNAILVFASCCGLAALYPRFKNKLPEHPGSLYILSYTLFFTFAVLQYMHTPSILSAGYIFATILWLMASNAIRLKFDASKV